MSALNANAYLTVDVNDHAYKQSAYTTTQWSNIPNDASYPYAIPHLNASIPQTQYPYDSVYDTQYQENIIHPKYRWYGNMEYPYFAQRHRQPKVYTRPKPSLRYDNGHAYTIPSYPPYVYWYPNPLKCRDTCGDDICNAYFQKINNYRNCRRCQNQKTPKCWDPKFQKCVACPPEIALESCSSRKRFGCANPNGWDQGPTQPINPIYTGCKLCH